MALRLDVDVVRSLLGDWLGAPAAPVERSPADDPLGEMFDRDEALLEQRPNARRVEVVRGAIDDTVRPVEQLILLQDR